jgi:mycofactocin precursor
VIPREEPPVSEPHAEPQPDCEPVGSAEPAREGEPTETVVADLLVEEISIDGMCGVY